MVAFGDDLARPGRPCTAGRRVVGRGLDAALHGSRGGESD